ncbi:unnamed protein product [Rhizophagus irregularis]|nr:unnamed protein product [Rhizophagus irregularis]
MSGEVEPDNDIEIKKGGRPRAVIWNFFIEGPDQGDGHRSAICSACNTTWKRGKASAMERHILLDCKKVKTEVREAIRCIIESRNKSQMSRNTDDDQKTLEEYYDALPLSEEKRIKIELSLIRLFVCCGLSWRLVEHPYFVEFIKELRSAYNLPNRKTLSGTLLDNEILRVNTEIYQLIKKEKNLTLSIDGWTSPAGKSKPHLSQKIEAVLNEIGTNRFSAIVTDSGSNVNLARKIITHKFPHIINIKCMAHCLNLITKDFIKHTFATRILNWSNMITTYFKKSHLPQSLLEDKIKEKSIKGGGLKTYVSTRWVTAFEMLQSIFRLEICLKEVILV